MFTGIIEEVGEIADLSEGGDFRTIRVRAGRVIADMKLGSSIAVNGVCLTATTVGPDVFTADLSHETLERTSLGRLKRGSIVNLERPMRADARFGGHIVQGHVDGVGQVRGFSRTGDSWDLEIEYSAADSRYIVAKGSIAIDGISLTVAALRGANVFSAAIIPHTFDNTNLRTAQAGDPINLEFDILAKYVENLIRR